MEKALLNETYGGIAVRLSVRKLLFVCLVLSSNLASAGIPLDTEFFGKTVVFLYAAATDTQPDTHAPIGTGFLVRVPHVNDSQITVLLVTARHMFDPLWAHCDVRNNPSVMFARLNSLDEREKVRYIRVPLQHDGSPLWFKHHDDDVDAAVITLPLPDDDIRTLDFRAIPIWRLPTDEELGMLSVGDDVVSAGMLVELRNTQKNYPVFKFGKISNIPAEDMETACGGMPFKVKAWLIAANLVPGNSGSPILYYPAFGEGGDIAAPGVQRIILIGVQSSSVVPSDVAYMTPASYIYEIIRSMNITGADLYRGKPKTK